MTEPGDEVVDLDAARTFLAALDFEQRLDAPHAFQTFPDWKKPTEKKKQRLSKKLFGALDELAPQLTELNRLGASVHVTINETDGEGRKQENIRQLRAVCADWDEVETYQHEAGYTVPNVGIAAGIEPSIVVRTPRGVHWYWLLHRLDPGEDFAKSCKQWVEIQKAISQTYKSDPSICSTSSTLRVPGFFHKKRHPLDSALFAEVTKALVARIKAKEIAVNIGSAEAYRLAREAYAKRGGEFAGVQMVHLEKCDFQIRYDLTRFVRGLGLKIQRRPTNVATPKIERHDKRIRQKRCQAMLERMAPAIQSDHGGDGSAWQKTKGVCGVGGDFGLEPAEFFPLLCQHWNPRCQPPWDEDELWEKLQACHRARTQPFGYMLDQDSPEYARRKAEFASHTKQAHEALWGEDLKDAENELGPVRKTVKIEGEQAPDPAWDGLSAERGGGGGKPPNDVAGVGTAGGNGGPGGDGDIDITNRPAPFLWQLRSINIPESVRGPDQLAMSHLGNSERFLDGYGDVVRYISNFDRWYVWNGKRWRKDEDVEETHARAPEPDDDTIESYIRASTSDPFDSGNFILELAKRVARKMHTRLHEVKVFEFDDEGNQVFEGNRPKLDKEATGARKKTWISHSIRTESENGFKQILNLSKTDRQIAKFPSYFDPYDYLINTTGGVINLATGVNHPHHPEFRQSKIVHIDPKRAPCPVWSKFLERVLSGDDDLIRFVQKSVGYSLTGETREQVLFLLYGLGRNGKSTFLNVLHDLTGEYAQHAEFSTFTERQSDVVRNDLARLHKSRLVTAVEPKSTGYLDEAVIKQVTGQDNVTARFLFQEHFEYKPRFKIWLASNHKPMIRGNDEGIWRRILMVPFTVTIPEEEKDPDLPHKLRAELPAIFQWAVDGARLWYEEGLEPPKIVREATQEYRDDMDSIGLFVSMRCVELPDVRAMASALYRHYVKWSEGAGERPLSQKKFGMRLEERGLRRRRTGKGYEYIGIAVREDTDQTSSSKPLYD